MKRFSVAILLLCLSAVLLSAQTKPDGRVLDRWVGGKWSGGGTMVDSAFSKAMKVSAVTTCVWSPNRVFVICDQASEADNKQHQQLSVYGYDPDAGKFHFYGMSPAEDKARSPELVISNDGTRWEYLNSDTIKGKPVRFRTVNVFRDADHVDWWTEYSSDDGEHWTRMGQGQESRQK